MQTSENGINFIKTQEGVKLTAYKAVPTEKYWTIGVGHYGKDVNPGMKITLEQALNYLKEDLHRFEKAVNNTNLDLNQNEFDALVSFTYNCGEGNLKKLIQNRNKQQIADALLGYNKSGGKIIDGLTKRRKRERELFLTPVQDNLQIETKLPFEVITNTKLNIRKGPSLIYPIIRVVDKNTKLKVWSIKTEDKYTWGKNGDEWYCLDYCTKL